MSDVYDQYATQPALRDALAEKQRIMSQYTASEPSFTPPPTPYDWGSKRPLAQPHPIHFWLSGAGAPPAGESLGSRLGGRGRRYSVDIEEPSEQAQQPEQEQQPHSPDYGSGRDFDDSPTPPINGSSGGAPVLGRPGPRPGGFSGGAAVPEPEMAEALF
jgi:hypothetical protein